MSRRSFLLAGLLVALLIAGVGSYYASSHPDGLEHVAEQTGFLDTAEDSPTAESPLADYQTSGIDDARVSGGLAGIVGSLVVLLLMGAIAYAIRRRGDGRADESTDEPGRSPQGVR